MVESQSAEFQTVFVALSNIAVITDRQNAAVTRLNARCVALSAGKRGPSLTAMSPVFAEALDEWSASMEADAKVTVDTWAVINQYEDFAFPTAENPTDMDRWMLTLATQTARDAEEAVQSALTKVRAMVNSFDGLRDIFPTAGPSIDRASRAISLYADSGEGGKGVGDRMEAVRRSRS